ncbi:FAD-binding oxidoreductase [Nordella sp. HKS 07]|uniref:NAD(P)/FAD-dependent oxidoreductase n=1 Tax=Nordella sp. HKS 07 TaxID=2712222 RepID=UPI0013E1B683|nr:FAD-binding oxidoreductase [Nordella sp. HKS 07]QIG50990.1 FAD-binding oxidoreductase [Nordella sp. HKS 07]
MSASFQNSLIEKSLWVATAGDAPDLPILEGETSCDVAIIGAGILGLSTALHAAAQGGSVIALDAATPGWGGGGRNGGQVNPGLKVDPEGLLSRFGPSTGGELAQFGAATADETFETLRKFGVECDSTQKGWLQLAHSPAALSGLEIRAREWRALGVAMEVLSAADAHRLTGSAAYAGGILNPKGGSLHPLKLVRGLAQAALAQGARIFRHSRVLKIDQARGRSGLVTAQGRVWARRVLIATDGYTDGLFPALERSVLPVSTFQIATEPLSGDVARSILPNGHHVSDTHRSLYYFRKDAQGRFLIGGRGSYGPQGAERAYRELERVAAKIYPELGHGPWAYRWGGMVAVTEDHLLHVTEPAPGILAAIGCNGRGVALSVALGRRLAEKLVTGAANSVLFPLEALRPIALHGLKKTMLPLIAETYSVLDHLDKGSVLRRNA